MVQAVHLHSHWSRFFVEQAEERIEEGEKEREFARVKSFALCMWGALRGESKGRPIRCGGCGVSLLDVIRHHSWPARLSVCRLERITRPRPDEATLHPTLSLESPCKQAPPPAFASPGLPKTSSRRRKVGTEISEKKGRNTSQRETPWSAPARGQSRSSSLWAPYRWAS